MDVRQIEHALEGRGRLVIAGGPGAGKSTLAGALGTALGLRVRPTDELVGQYAWSGVSDVASRWMDEAGGWVIEGAAAPRALRKWLARNPSPVAAQSLAVLWMPRAVKSRTDAQSNMARGVETVWREILPDLRRRGVKVIEL